VFDAAAIRAQEQLPHLQGQQHSYFCGAWAGYGFHEDGLKAGLQAARLLLDDWARQTQQAPVQAPVQAQG
jgi:predicted NAD/FAD-binding protein